MPNENIARVLLLRNSFFLVYPHFVILLYKGLVVPVEVEREKCLFVGVYLDNKIIEKQTKERERDKKINEDNVNNRNELYTDYLTNFLQYRMYVYIMIGS